MAGNNNSNPTSSAGVPNVNNFVPKPSGGGENKGADSNSAQTAKHDFESKMAAQTEAAAKQSEMSELASRQQASRDQQESQAQAYGSQYDNFVNTASQGLNYFADASSIYVDKGTVHGRTAEGSVTDMVYSYTMQGTQESETKQAVDRLERTKNVASLVLGNYQAAQVTNDYNKIMSEIQSDAGLSRQLGVSSYHQDRLNEYMSCCTFHDGNIDVTNTANLYKNGQSGFMFKGNDSAIASLVSSGSFNAVNGQNASFSGNFNTQNISCNVLLPDGTSRRFHKSDFSMDGTITQESTGIKYKLSECKVLDDNKRVSNFSVEEFMNADFGKLNRCAQNEAHTNSVIKEGVNNVNARTAAMEQMYKNGLENLKDMSPTMRTSLTAGAGNKEEVAKQLNKIKNDLNNNIKKGNLSPEALAKAKAQVEQIEKFQSTFKDAHFNSSMSSSQKSGMKIAQNYILGDDMAKGVNMIVNTTKTAQKLTKSIHGAALRKGVKDANKMLAVSRFGTKVTNKIGVTHTVGDSKASELLEKHALKQKEKLSKYTERVNARKNPVTWQEYKNNQKMAKLNDKSDKLSRSKTRLEARKSEIAARQQRRAKGVDNDKLNKKTEAINKKIERKESNIKNIEEKKLRRKARDEKRVARNNKKLLRKEKFNNSIVGKAKQLVEKAFQKIFDIFTGVKILILQICGYVIAFVIVLCALAGIATVLGTSLNRFLSWVPNFEFDMFGNPTATTLVAELNDRNYNQYIVDKVCLEMGDSFMAVAKRDAENHFLTEGKIYSDNGYYWYKDVISGELGYIWMREEADNTTTIDGNGIISGYEQGIEGRKVSGTGSTRAYDKYVANEANRQQLKSLNSNVLPCLAMAMERFPEDITYENYLTVMAYMYYMYAETHDTSRFDSNAESPYIGEEVDDCDETELYDAHGERVWDMTAQMVKTPTVDKCTNIYIHGYDRAWGESLNKTKAKAEESVASVLAWINTNFGTTFGGSTLPVGTELCYKNSSGSITFIKNPSNNLTHTYKLTPEATYTTGSAFIYKEGSITKIGCDNIKYYQWTNNENKTFTVNGTTYKSYLADELSTCPGKEHKHTASCFTRTCVARAGSVSCTCSHSSCPKVPIMVGSVIAGYRVSCTCSHSSCPRTGGHSHSSFTNSDVSVLRSQGKVNNATFSYNGCDYKRTCSYSYEHTHNPWQSIDRPGCWRSIAVCGGHCGGHIRPVVNVVETYTWEGLMCADIFKVVHFMSAADFADIALDDDQLEYIEDWKGYWRAKCATWFLPFPNSPLSFASWIGESIVKWGAKTIDAISGWWASLWSSDPDYYKSDDAKLEEDVYEFPGWWINETTLNTELIEDMVILYGSYADDYEHGESGFDVGVWEVKFALGPNRKLSSSRINEIMNSISVSGSREAACRTALESVGCFWYSKSITARANGASSKSGCSDDAGFISGILYRSGAISTTRMKWGVVATKHEPDCYVDHSYGGSSLSSGDILINEDKNTMCIYIGIVADEYGNYSHYVVDCTSETNGAAFRAVSSAELTGYTLRHSY